MGETLYSLSTLFNLTQERLIHQIRVAKYAQEGMTLNYLICFFGKKTKSYL
jgi:hypothetical protein